MKNVPFAIVAISSILLIATIALLPTTAQSNASPWTGTWGGTLQEMNQGSTIATCNGCSPSTVSNESSEWSFSFTISVSAGGSVSGNGFGSSSGSITYSGCEPDAVTFRYDISVTIVGSTSSSGTINLAFQELWSPKGPTSYSLNCGGNTEISGGGAFTSSESYTISPDIGTSQTFAIPTSSSTTTCNGPNGCTVNSTSSGSVTIILNDGPSSSQSGGQTSSQPSISLNCRPLDPAKGTRFDCEAEIPNLQYPSTGLGSMIQEGGNAIWSSSPNSVLKQSTCANSYESYISVDLTVVDEICDASFAAVSAGPATITFQFIPYMDNPSVQASITFYIIPAYKASPSLAIVCDPSVVNQTLDASCIANLSGSAGTPTGTVYWNTTSPNGFFSNSTCSLVNGSCGTQYSQNSTSPTTISSTYFGNSAYDYGLASTSITSIVNSSASADQTQTTGLSMTVNGTTGSLGMISSLDYSSQPGGTGTSPFPSAEYFDIKAQDMAGGTAYACYYGTEVNSTTSMDYYNGSWISASGANALSGTKVCGSIPVSALSGTPIAIGDTSAASYTNSASESNSSLLMSISLPVGRIEMVTVAVVALAILLGVAGFAIRRHGAS